MAEGRWHQAGSVAADDPSRVQCLHDVPRRAGRPARAGLRRRIDDAEVPVARHRGPARVARRAGRLGCPRCRRREEARRGGDCRGPSRIRSAAGTVSATAIAADSACTCRPCSRHSGSPRWPTMPATTGCGRSPDHPLILAHPARRALLVGAPADSSDNSIRWPGRAHALPSQVVWSGMMRRIPGITQPSLPGGRRDGGDLTQ